MERGLLVGNVVGRSNRRTAGIVVVKFPGREHSVAPRAALDLDHAGRPEVGPGEFFLTRPDELHRLAGRPGQPGRLDGRLAGVLAAVAGAGVGHDHAHGLGSERRKHA